jgi:15-cis-phytoene synthase
VTAEACAAMVERGDPDRFRAAMVAPPGRRPGLMALYAFNLEVARAALIARALSGRW